MNIFSKIVNGFLTYLCYDAGNRLSSLFRKVLRLPQRSAPIALVFEMKKADGCPPPDSKKNPGTVQDLLRFRGVSFL